MKKQAFSLHLHIGATADSVTINGHTFDRSKMSREQKHDLRRNVVRGFQQSLEKPKQRATA